MHDPTIVSVGNLDDYPKELWGTRDRAQAQREGRARAQVTALTSHRPTQFEPLTVQPIPASASSFKLDSPRRPRDQSARSKSVDQLLDRLHVR